MEIRLLPINALLGLLIPGDINPPVLAKAGFRIAGLEIPAAGRHGKAVIDVLLLHEDTNHLVACESKSGANVEEAQAKAYAGLTVENVVQAASVTLRTLNQPTLEVLYLCQTVHSDRIRLGLKTLELAFPVLAIGELQIDLFDSEYASTLLREPLRGGLRLEAPPARVISFDAESSQDVIAPLVKATMVALLARRVNQVSLTSLTEEALRHYGLYGHAAQNRLKAAVEVAVRGIVEQDPERFAFDRRTGSRPESLVRFLKTPEDFDPRGRTQAYQALGRDVRPGSRRASPPLNQMDLLRELDLVENEEEESASDGEKEGDPT